MDERFAVTTQRGPAALRRRVRCTTSGSRSPACRFRGSEAGDHGGGAPPDALGGAARVAEPAPGRPAPSGRLARRGCLMSSQWASYRWASVPTQRSLPEPSAGSGAWPVTNQRRYAPARTSSRFAEPGHAKAAISVPAFVLSAPALASSPRPGLRVPVMRRRARCCTIVCDQARQRRDSQKLARRDPTPRGSRRRAGPWPEAERLSKAWRDGMCVCVRRPPALRLAEATRCSTSCSTTRSQINRPLVGHVLRLPEDSILVASSGPAAAHLRCLEEPLEAFHSRGSGDASRPGEDPGAGL